MNKRELLEALADLPDETEIVSPELVPLFAHTASLRADRHIWEGKLVLILSDEEDVNG